MSITDQINRLQLENQQLAAELKRCDDEYVAKDQEFQQELKTMKLNNEEAVEDYSLKLRRELVKISRNCEEEKNAIRQRMKQNLEAKRASLANTLQTEANQNLNKISENYEALLSSMTCETEALQKKYESLLNEIQQLKEKLSSREDQARLKEIEKKQFEQQAVDQLKTEIKKVNWQNMKLIKLFNRLINIDDLKIIKIREHMEEMKRKCKEKQSSTKSTPDISTNSKNSKKHEAPTDYSTSKERCVPLVPCDASVELESQHEFKYSPEPSVDLSTSSNKSKTHEAPSTDHSTSKEDCLPLVPCGASDEPEGEHETKYGPGPSVNLSTISKKLKKHETVSTDLSTSAENCQPIVPCCASDESEGQHESECSSSPSGKYKFDTDAPNQSSRDDNKRSQSRRSERSSRSDEEVGKRKDSKSSSRVDSQRSQSRRSERSSGSDEEVGTRNDSESSCFCPNEINKSN